MVVSFIVAVSENNAIGKDNELPWYLPADLKFFKTTTLGKPVIMGRKTFESLGKPLPGRLNIVLSGQAGLQLPDGVLVYHNIENAIERAALEGTEEIFIIGGGKIFSASMQYAERMYITKVYTVIPGAEAFFPEVDHTHWKLAWEEAHEPDEKNKFAYTFQRYERIEL